MKRTNPFRPIRVDLSKWQQWERVALDAEMLTRDPLHAARAFKADPCRFRLDRLAAAFWFCALAAEQPLRTKAVATT
jgi:hypothetical protein